MATGRKRKRDARLIEEGPFDGAKEYDDFILPSKVILKLILTVFLIRDTFIRDSPYKHMGFNHFLVENSKLISTLVLKLILAKRCVLNRNISQRP